MRTTNLMFALFGALLLTACGGKGNSPFSPSDPVAPPTTLVGNVNGTVVEGTSATTAHTASVGDALANLKVSVEGSNLSAMTDGQGGFVLANVPAGSVALRFEAAGVNARLGGLAVSNGQTLTIKVGVSGSTAVLLDLGNPTPTPTPSPNPTQVTLDVPPEHWAEVTKLVNGTSFVNTIAPDVNLVVPEGYDRESDFAKSLWAGLLTFSGGGATMTVVADPTVAAEAVDGVCGTSGVRILMNPQSLRYGGGLMAHGLGHLAACLYDVRGNGLMGLGMELSPAERWLVGEKLRIAAAFGQNAQVTLRQLP